MRSRLVLGAFCLGVATSPALAATWHVRADAAAGGDGRSAAGAFATVQQAADVVKAGDTVVIGPGVYFESVQLRAKGTPEAPIVFKADRIEKDRVIFTGADPAVRKKGIKWTVEDAALGLYAIPWDKPPPTRVLYSGADLYPYFDVDRLRQFMAVPARNHRGPQHGYALDVKAKRLYVRLHASAKYGPADPNQHVMCISGPLGGGVVGLDVSGPEHYNLGILGQGDAHVVVQGITFETPGSTGVYTEANDVVVEDCWFIGCRAGVTGTAPYFMPKDFSYATLANRVVVQYCSFTQFPTYDDGLETMRLAVEAGDKEVVFWARKDFNGGLRDQSLNYETGITCLMGRDWIVRNSHVWNAFEAFSSRSTTSSDNARIHDNIFENLLDNAVEAEDHSTNLRVYRNLIRDTFGPLSWQPLENEPWPGPFYCYQNVIYNTPEHQAAFAFRKPSIFKIGATGARKTYGKDYLPIVPDPGILFFNNTILWDRGCLFWPAIWGNNPDKVKLCNNIILTEFNLPPGWTEKWHFLTIENNLCVPKIPVEGLENQTASSLDALRLDNVETVPLRPLADSPAVGKAIAVKGMEAQLKDIGALQTGDDWYPPKVGPRIATEVK